MIYLFVKEEELIIIAMLFLNKYKFIFKIY